jgi:hypothetical protein
LAEALLQLFGAQQQFHVRLPLKVPREMDGASRLSGNPRVPGLEAAIEDEHAVALAQPGQQPPGPRRIGTRAVVVQNHFAVGIDAPGLQTLDQAAGSGNG